jgi:membrane protease YdiL (CAAX protease family)
MLQPVPRKRRVTPGELRRRRVVAALTLVVGAVVLSVAVRIPPGDPDFYLATGVLAVVWTLGALASGPAHVGYAHTRAGGVARPGVQALAVGAVLLGVFVVGGLVVARIPALSTPVLELLDHAEVGSLPLVALLTAVNGVGEELYFRGALYAALPRATAVWLSTLLYALTVIGSGIWLLVLAAALLGLVTALQRRVTGGVLAPVITHLVFSLGMLFVLPSVLHVGS